MAEGIENKSDSELFLILKDGGRNGELAFKEIYKRYSQKIYTYCRKFLGSVDAVDDVFQETFINFYNNAKNYSDIQNLNAFLFKIARNLCINYKTRKVETREINESDFFYDELNSDKNELNELILKAIEKLPDDFKEVIILREYDGLSYKEIAEVTNTKIENVKVRIFRAKEKIRQILAPYLKEFEKYS